MAMSVDIRLPHLESVEFYSGSGGFKQNLV